MPQLHHPKKEKAMKQKVIIFTGKHHFKPIDKTTPNGDYDEKALMEIANKIFPSDNYEVDIVDYPKCTSFYNINDIWKEVRTPILIGYKEGANYIKPIKNYKRKYLISPMVFPNSFNEPTKRDEYDEENTICLFGGDEKSLKNAHKYEEYYPYTHYEISEGELDLYNGIGYAMIFEAMLSMAEQ